MTGHRGLKYWKESIKNLKGRLVIGLTGAPASGKSAALAMFERRGWLCLSADEVAREVLTGKECYNRILRKFGPEIVLKDGTPDRRGLSLEIFGDSSKRKWLEGLLHPEILKRFHSLIKKSHIKKVVVEAPLLFEAGIGDCFSLVICVSAPLKERAQRAARKGWSGGELRRRAAAQFSAGRKAALADINILNDRGLRELEQQIEGLCGLLKAFQTVRGGKIKDKKSDSRRTSENGK
jgi:dephospho-CoA kinase